MSGRRAGQCLSGTKALAVQSVRFTGQLSCTDRRRQPRGFDRPRRGPMGLDAAGAVAALASAGNDLQALAEAIAEASFLDATPGNDRQKLRAARTQLRKLLKEVAAKEAAAAAKSAADRSPHAKQSYDAAEYDALVHKYEKLNWRIISKPGGATVKPDEFYTLYSYHMQADKGNNTSERPMWAEKGGLDFEGRAKWDAWTAVKGMKPDKAKLEFVRAYYEFPVKVLYTDTRSA